ncbi:MAG: hypothetical protein ABI042_12040 [Verrucomicrobiota bacterium]
MSHLIFRGTDRAFVLGLFLIFAASFPIELRAANQATLKIQDSTIHVEFSSEPTEELRPLLLGWIARSARAVAIYYGQFPVKFLEIRVNLKEGRRITSGQTLGWNGPLIKISAGLASTASTFSDDWEMTHEMTHLAFPGVASSHHWIEEGSATYVEPVARARAGDLTPEKVWGDMLKGMRNGLPQSGDRGLDFTPTWGRTYWGGALFCLMADIEIHRRTKNLKGLDDALRAILKAGGNITRDWDLDRALDTGDRATGVNVLREMYDEWKASPVMVDLNELWKNLGVIRDGRAIRFDDSAPMASIRRAITAPNRTP